MTHRMKVLLFFFLIFCEIFADTPHKTECDKDRAQAIALSPSCCLLTRPFIDPEAKACVSTTLESFNKKKNLTRTEKLGLNICIEECIYINNGFINPDPPYAIDLNFVKEKLVEIMPEPKEVSVVFMLDAYQTCSKFRSEHPNKLNINFPDLSITDTLCTSYPLEITSCIRILGMQNCPTIFFEAGEACEKAKKFFSTCVANLSS